MGLFGLFRKQKLETEQIELGVADKIVIYLLELIYDKQNVKEQIKEIIRIQKLPINEREQPYLPVYLSLEKHLIASKPYVTKEYFSPTVLKKPREYTKEQIRIEIKQKFEVNKLPASFRVIFLQGPQQSLLLYELMVQKMLSLTPMKSISNISNALAKSDLRDFKIQNNNFDFSVLNKKIAAKPLMLTNIAETFKSLFLMLYNELASVDGKEFADKIMSDLYNYIGQYGHPLDSAALKVLPKTKSAATSGAAARSVLEYVTDMFAREDLIRPQLERIKDAEMLTTAEKDKSYFEVYLQLEKVLTEHGPPAVKKRISVEELRSQIKENINIEYLDRRFRILFLEEQLQVIEVYASFYEYLLKNVTIFWKPDELQKFLRENIKGMLVEPLLELTIGKEFANFNISEKINKLPKNKINNIVHEFSLTLNALSKKIKELAGTSRTEKLLLDAFLRLKENYGMLSSFNDFIREIPEGILDFYKKITLSPKASENVVKYLIEILPSEDINEHIQAFEEAKKLPVEQQSEAFFKIYLNLQIYIIERRPVIKGKSITISDLKEKIRKNVNIKDLEDKFQLLFLNQDEMLVKLVKDLVKECISNFIDKKVLLDAERQLINHDKMLKGVKIDDDGFIDFDPFMENISNVKKDRVKIFEGTLFKVVSVVYDKSKSILGELQTKRLFESAYISLQKKYGASLLQVLKLVPKGVLEAEKFELLGKEEIEKTAKEMVKIDIMKGEFMNIAAHELKTPLVPIISYTEMLLEDKRLPKDVKEKLRICLASAKREADLVSDILDISKLEAGTMKLEVEEVDMVDLLKEVTGGMAPAVKQKNIYFKAEVPSKLPFAIVDRRRIIQVISNLINNATKFTEKGGITVKAVADDKNITISVSDTGMGISPENQKKLFTKFFQVDSTERRKQGGTGLGLAICKGIVEGHKGKILLESTLGKGTTFSFTIPHLGKK